MTDYTTRATCRVCGADSLIPLFALGKQYVNDFLAVGEEPKHGRCPITLELCRTCTLVQLKHTAPQEILYSRKYWYRSGVTATMQAALADVCRAVLGAVRLAGDNVVLDIGSNDGTLLRAYAASLGLVTVGVEPAANLAKVGSLGISCFINDFWNFDTYWKQVGCKAKAITACGMFYDLEDPNQFIADISKALSKDGIFIAQLMCLKNMLNVNDVGNLAHEHLEFYSLKSLNYLLGRHGLELIDIETNKVNGESYRLFIRPVDGSVQPSWGAGFRLRKAHAAEAGLDRPELYQDFFSRMERNRLETCAFIKGIVGRGKKVWVYGASTKGNVILQYYGLNHALIVGAAERSPEKVGLRTVGTNIPIYTEEDARKAMPDYFLVLPFAFIDEFVEREQNEEWRKRGGKFIVPLPAMRII